MKNKLCSSKSKRRAREKNAYKTNMLRTFSLLVLTLLLTLALTSCLLNDGDAPTGEGPNDGSTNDTPTATLSFELNEDGKSYSVARSKIDPNDKNIIIPTTHNYLPVTAIGNMAFYDCTTIESVKIPNGIKSIGSNAFCGCTGLAEVIMPDSVTEIGDFAFSSCVALGNIDLSDGLVKIGDFAFNECSSLTEIVMPDSLTELGAAAFRTCTALQTATVGKNVTEMKASTDRYNGYGTFAECTELKHVELPSGISYIPAFAFGGCTSLAEIEIPDGVIEIQERAFSFCSSLTAVTIPKSVGVIGDGAFGDCISLFEICNKSALTLSTSDFISAKNIITDSSDSKIKNIDGFVFYDDGEKILLIKYIGEQTALTLPQYEGGKKYAINTRIFTSTPKITEMTIPDCVSSISARAFCDCTALEVLTLNCSEAEIDRWYFEENQSVKTVYINVDNNFYCSFFQNLDTAIYGEGVSYIEKETFYGSSVKKVVISSTVTEIRESAFKDSDIAELVFAEGSRLEVIGASAFSHCSYLKTPVFPDGLKSIGERAFEISGVNSIGLGLSLISIGDAAFDNSAIKSVSLPDSLKTIGNGSFAHCLSFSKIEIGEESQLESIGDEAFILCERLGSIYLPKNLSSLGKSAFVSTSLRVIRVADDNPYFEKMDEELYSEDKTVLVLSPQKRGNPCVTIPASVKEIAPSAFRAGVSSVTEVVFEEGSQLEIIGEMAFYGCGITEISIPAGVKRIDKEAFGYCQLLKSVTFADGIKLTELSDGIFRDCYSLSSITISAYIVKIGEKAFFYTGIVDVYYEGSQEMWNEIEKGDGWNSGMGDYLNNYTVHCSDGDIEND